jgi:diguanylate cyclase (GGDEF)-like protein
LPIRRYERVTAARRGTIRVAERLWISCAARRIYCPCTTRFGSPGCQNAGRGRVIGDIGLSQSDEERAARSRAQRSSDDARSASNADQGEADADQTASDQDQTASNRDDADAARDQRAANRDQTKADERRSVDPGGAGPEGYEALRLAHEETTASRLSTHAARVKTSRSRAETANARDASAAGRDETAQRRDVREEQEEELERSVAASGEPLAHKLEEVRARATASRARAAAGRDRAVQSETGVAREFARLEAELQSAHLDDLTGAFRREMGRLALNQEIDRARRADGRFVIAYVDVDGMKRVNDEAGHAAGDHVLQTLVLTLRANLRSFDPIVRYGGDEFVVGLGGVDNDVVARRFEIIDLSVHSDVGVGISVGLAGLEPDDTLDRITARADASLLIAKRQRSEGRGA